MWQVTAGWILLDFSSIAIIQPYFNDRIAHLVSLSRPLTHQLQVMNQFELRRSVLRNLRFTPSGLSRIHDEGFLKTARGILNCLNTYKSFIYCWRTRNSDIELVYYTLSHLLPNWPQEAVLTSIFETERQSHIITKLCQIRLRMLVKGSSASNHVLGQLCMRYTAFSTAIIPEDCSYLSEYLNNWVMLCRVVMVNCHMLYAYVCVSWTDDIRCLGHSDSTPVK